MKGGKKKHLEPVRKTKIDYIEDARDNVLSIFSENMKYEIQGPSTMNRYGL